MNITKVSVTWGETQSIPEYCNVKPSVTLEATLDNGDSYGEELDFLMAQAQIRVREKIDEALEGAGKVAKYSEERRYKARQSKDRKCIVIVPKELSDQALPIDFYNVIFIPEGARLSHLLKLIGDHHPKEGVQVIDLSDCDLTRIPPLPQKEAELDMSTKPEEEWEELESEDDDNE